MRASSDHPFSRAPLGLEGDFTHSIKRTLSPLLTASFVFSLLSLCALLSHAQKPAVTPIHKLIPESQITALQSLIIGSIKHIREGFHHAVPDYYTFAIHRQNALLLHLDIIYYYATLRQFSKAETILEKLPPESSYHAVGKALILFHQENPQAALDTLTPHLNAPLHLIHRIAILSHIQLLNEKAAAEHIRKTIDQFPPQWHQEAALKILPSILEETIYPSDFLEQSLRDLLQKAIQTEETTAILAAAEFEIAMRKPHLAIKILRNATPIEKRSELPILTRLAELEYQHNTPQSALPYYLQALRKNPDSPNLRESIAKLYSHIGKDDLALPHWQAIHLQYPTRILPITEIALIHEKNNNPQEALQYWIKARTLQPENPRFHIAVILKKLALKQIHQALQDAQQFKQKFSTLARAHYLEGIIQFNLKNYAAADAAFTQTESLATTTDPEILDAQFYVQRATILDYLKQPYEAIKILSLAHQKFPENIVIMNNLAYSFAEQNIELETALSLSLKTIEAQPKNASFLDTLGWIYYRMQRYPDAIATLQKALKLDPENPIILDHLADAYAQNNHLDKALPLWKKAVLHHEAPQEIQNKITQAQKAVPMDHSTPGNKKTTSTNALAFPPPAPSPVDFQ